MVRCKILKAIMHNSRGFLILLFVSSNKSPGNQLPIFRMEIHVAHFIES